jgi:predicted glutamine amidotransferase
MCRLFGFRSAVDSRIHQSLVAAENALAMQSNQHRDGWGISYYIDQFPHLIRNDEQALNDVLFRELSGVVATRTFVAHIRQATAGEVRVLNCHPFQHGRWTFAHNGEIGGWNRPEVRERVRECVDERFRRYLLGDTDSESMFYIFLSHLARGVDNIQEAGVRLDQVGTAVQQMLDRVRETVSDPTDAAEHKLTVLLTNGNVMLACRYRRELHYSTHKTRCPERATCYAFEPNRCEADVGQDGIVKHLVIASEPVAEGPNVWHELHEGAYVGVDHGMNFHRGHFDVD